MGRVKRYKRIKAIDPFSKTGGRVDLDAGKSFNLGPSKKDVEAIPRAIQVMLAQKAALAGEKPTLRPDKPKSTTFFGHVKPLPGESMGAFHRRLNNERTKALSGIRQEAKDAKHISGKRKEYLDKKKEKKRQRGSGLLQAGYAADTPDPTQLPGGLSGGKKRKRQAERERARAQAAGEGDGDSDGGPAAKRRAGAGGEARMDFPTDSVSFGERAMEPPKLTVKPRKSQVRATPLRGPPAVRRPPAAARGEGRLVVDLRPPPAPARALTPPCLAPSCAPPARARAAEAKGARGRPQGAQGGGGCGAGR